MTKQEFEESMYKVLMDEVDVNRIVNYAIRRSKPYYGASDGSYEASLYYYVCRCVDALRSESEASDEVLTNNQEVR